MNLVDRVYREAVESLRRCCRPHGMIASGQRLGHHQVWARDSMMAVLGGRLTEDEVILEALHKSVAVLREHQSASGCIPNNVNPDSGRPNFRAYADGGLWWILGSGLLAPDPITTKRILGWYECQDVDQSGLVSMQESADWQDLFCTRGKGLYLNCLYVMALLAAANQSETDAAARLRDRAQAVRDRINKYFWYNGDGKMLLSVAHTFSTETPEEQDSLGRKRWLPKKHLLSGERFYLPYLAFRTPGEWFDTLGHLMAILAGVAEGERAGIALDFIAANGLDHPPAASIFPTIEPHTSEWRPYYGMLNVPHHYHNGGVWPFIGGFYVAALVYCGRIKQAASVLKRLAHLNSEGQFNEWHHGKTGEAMGVHDQAWSSAMYIYAWHCVQRGALPEIPSLPILRWRTAP